MCRKIMASQVEHGEETLAPVTEADETQQQPEKSRCVHVYVCVCTDAGTNVACSMCEFELVFVHVNAMPVFVGMRDCM